MFLYFHSSRRSVKGFAYVLLIQGTNILSETIARSAIENVVKYLSRAIKDGWDMEAREHITYASTVGGITMKMTLAKGALLYLCMITNNRSKTAAHCLRYFIPCMFFD